MDCSICLEPYNQEHKRPMVLECGHTFCILCVNQLYLKPKKECPIDRSPLTQPITKVKVNYSLQEIISSFSNISLSSSPLKSVQSHISSHINTENSQLTESNPTFPNLLCYSGHPLACNNEERQTRSRSRRQNSLSLNICSFCQSEIFQVYWSCQACRFFLCLFCTEEQKACQVLDSDYPLLCNNSHMIYFYKSTEKFCERMGVKVEVVCNGCEGRWKGGAWSCRICRFNLCSQCVDKAQLAVQLQCNKQHFLHEVRAEGNQVLCTVCKVLTRPRGYTCRPCQFFMCENCADYFNKSNFLPISCSESHGLVYSDDQLSLYFIRTNRKSFTCNGCWKVCTSLKNFHCRRCDFDLCDICYGTIVQGVSTGIKARCRGNHELLWFSDTCKFYKSCIKCDICSRSYDKCGSFHCRLCRFDICLLCASNLINR